MNCKPCFILHVTLLLLLGCILLAGCGKSDPPATPRGTAARPAVVNTTCPIMGGDVHPAVTGNLYTIFDGQGVGFCCPGCKDKFDALSDTEKIKKLAAAK